MMHDVAVRTPKAIIKRLVACCIHLTGGLQDSSRPLALQLPSTTMIYNGCPKYCALLRNTLLDELYLESKISKIMV